MTEVLLWLTALVVYVGYAALAVAGEAARDPWVAGVFIVLSMGLWLMLRRRHGKG